MTRKLTGLGVMLVVLTVASGCRVATLGFGESTVASRDGLGLKFDLGGRIVAVTVDGKELPQGLSRAIVPGGFYLREPGKSEDVEILGAVHKSADAMEFTASPAGLDMWAIVQDMGDYLEIRGRVTNGSRAVPGPGGEAGRGVTVGVCLPVDAAGWVFGRSILDSEPIRSPQSPDLLTMTGRVLALPITVPATVLGLAKAQSPEESGTYAEWTCADSDWDGRQINHGMITPIYSEHAGLALGAVSEHPEIFRVNYRLGHGFSIEADLGLSPLPQKYPNTATFQFVFYRFDPKQHYRGALAKYYGMFPDDYTVRSGKFGNCIAYDGELSGIRGKAPDYQVAFKTQTTSDVFGTTTAPEKDVYPFENARGHYDLVPVCAGTPDRPMAPVAVIRRAVFFYWAAQSGLSRPGWEQPGNGAEMNRNSYATGPDGQMRIWSSKPQDGDGGLFSNGGLAVIVPTNPDPKLDRSNRALDVLGRLRIMAEGQFSFREGGRRALGQCLDQWSDFAGRYLENYRPDHLEVVDYPLTYSYHTGRPVQFHAFMWQELARPLAEYLHSQNLLVFADDRPWRMSVMFDQPLIDVHGSAGPGRPVRDIAAMAYLRALVGAKPISGGGIGQAVDDPDKTYSPRDLAQFERDLNILAPYGWFPGGFGPKALWQKYCLPMQEMAAAGWEPITGAVLAHPDLIVERWGGGNQDAGTPRRRDAGTGNREGDGAMGRKGEKVFYAVHNRSEVPVSYELAIDLKLPHIEPKTVAVVERFAGSQGSPEATVIENSLVLRSRVAGRGTNLFELSDAKAAGGAGKIPANAELKTPLSPKTSHLRPLAAFDPKKSASTQFDATMARLHLRPKTAGQFLAAYALEKRELAAAVAFHLAREKVRDNLDQTATELANWLAPTFDGIYEAVLPAPTMTNWTAMRAYYKNPTVWKLTARARLRPADGTYDVEVFDPLLEKE